MIYFPKNTTWFDYADGYQMIGGNIYNVTSPLNTTPPIYLRGGKLILTQDTAKVSDTRDLNNVFFIRAAFSNDSTV